MEARQRREADLIAEMLIQEELERRRREASRRQAARASRRPAGPPAPGAEPEARPASSEAGEAAEVGGAVRPVAERDVLDGLGFDSRLLDRALDRMGRHRHRRRDVEAAASCLGKSGAGIGNEDCFAHGCSSR